MSEVLPKITLDLYKELTPTEAAEFRNVSTRKQEKERQDGTGPKYLKVSYRTVRYRLIDLLEYQEQHLVENTIQGAQILGEGALKYSTAEADAEWQQRFNQYNAGGAHGQKKRATD
jgi:hypothetical protein